MIVAAVYSNRALAQSTRLVRIGIELQDASTELAVYNAKVSVFDSVGDCLADSLPMVVWKPTFPTSIYEMVTYEANLPFMPHYVLNISAVGYSPHQLTLRQSECDNGPLPIVYLVNNAYVRKLNEVEVKASRIKMVQDGDTLIFNASAFVLPEGSMLDALIQSLPGAKIDANGRITVNGEFVKELFINGRRFFSGNPQVALQNLPSYTVNKIKVYKQDADDSHGLPGADKELIMDVNLKREYHNSWIATVEGGGGSTLTAPADTRWMGRLFATRFNRRGYAAAYASGNNLNNTGGVNRRGEWSTNSASEGVVSTKRSGAEYSLDWDDQPGKGISSTIEITRKGANVTTRETNEYYLPAGNVLNRSSNYRDSKEWLLNWKGSLSRKFARAGALWFDAGIDYQTGKDNDSSKSDEKREDSTVSVYQREKLLSGNTDRFAPSGKISFTTISIGSFVFKVSAAASFEKTGHSYFANDIIRYSRSEGQDKSLLQQSDRPRLAFNGRGNAEIFRYWRFNDEQMLSAMMGYKFGCIHSDDTRQLYESDDEETLLLSPNSYKRVSRQYENGAYGRVIAQFRKFHLAVVGDAYRHNRRLHENRGGNDVVLKKKDWQYKLDSEISYIKSDQTVRLRFNYDRKIPEITNYLDVIDVTDPMNLRLGNPGLLCPDEYSCSLRWTNRWSKYQSQLSCGVDYAWTDHAIALSHIYDSTTGINIFRPDNVNGNMNISVPIYCSSFIGENQKLYVYNCLNPKYTMTCGFTAQDNETSISKVFNWNVVNNLEVSLSASDAVQLSLNVDLEWSRFKSGSELFAPFSFLNANCGVGLTYNAPWKIGIVTSISADTRNGYVDAEMNRTFWVWNLEVGRPIYKGLSVKFTAFDLLHQLPSMHQKVNSDGRFQTISNSKPAYALLTLSYRLDIKPGN